MKPYIKLSILSTVLLLTACSGDFFDQTIDVKVPEHTPQLAITSQLVAGDSTAWVYVTQSQGILVNGEAAPIEDATVELYKDGQLLEILPFFDSRFYAKELASPLSADPAEYQLKISAPGFDPVEAVQEMPVTVPIVSATYDPEGALDADGERVDEVSVEINDPAGVENFYQLSIVIENENWNNDVYLRKLDPLSEGLGDNQYLKDDSFDGKKYTWRVGFYPQYFQPGTTSKIRIELYSVSSDQYFYERSVSLSEDANDNPFAEPVIIHGNVVGGQGVFSLSAKSEAVIEP